MVYNSVNLLEDSLQPLSHWEKVYIWINHTAKYLLILAEISLIITFTLHLYYDNKLNTLKNKINQEIKLLQEHRKQESTIVIVNKALTELSELDKEKTSTAERRKYILSLVPPEVTITSFMLNFDTVTIAGNAGSYDAIRTLFDNFNNAKDIDKDSIVTSTSQLNQSNILFNLTCKFKK